MKLIVPPDLLILLLSTDTVSPVIAEPINSHLEFDCEGEGGVGVRVGGEAVGVAVGVTEGVVEVFTGGVGEGGVGVRVGGEAVGGTEDVVEVFTGGVGEGGVGVRVGGEAIGVTEDVVKVFTGGVGEGLGVGPTIPTSFNPKSNAVIAPITPPIPVKTPDNIVQNPPLL